jgi:hypothetical protein
VRVDCTTPMVPLQPSNHTHLLVGLRRSFASSCTRSPRRTSPIGHRTNRLSPQPPALANSRSGIRRITVAPRGLKPLKVTPVLRGSPASQLSSAGGCASNIGSRPQDLDICRPEATRAPENPPTSCRRRSTQWPDVTFWRCGGSVVIIASDGHEHCTCWSRRGWRCVKRAMTPTSRPR